MNYNEIKELKKELGCTRTDLLVLAPQNDPFYVGTPSQLRDANWFAEQWERYGFGDGVHLRRVHYALGGYMPDLPLELSWTEKKTGEKKRTSTYINEARCWKYLANASKYARYLRLVPPEAFVDHRNPDAKCYADNAPYSEPDPQCEIEDPSWPMWRYNLPSLPNLSPLDRGLPDWPHYEVNGYDNRQQAYHVEMWAEKSTMNDVLVPLCSEYRVNLVTGLGEMSITSVLNLLNRVDRARRPVRLLYVSDYDDKGQDMPVSVARKIEFFVRERGWCEDRDIRLQPVVLTKEQIDRYDLPQAPDTKTLTVELDALESLYPGVLYEILAKELERYIDLDLQNRTNEARRDLEIDLENERRDIIEGHRATIEALENDYMALYDAWEQTRTEFAELVEDFQPKINQYEERLESIEKRWQEESDKIAKEMEQQTPYLGPDDIPDPELSPERNARVLFDTARDYLSQLDAYNEHRNRR